MKMLAAAAIASPPEMRNVALMALASSHTSTCMMPM